MNESLRDASLFHTTRLHSGFLSLLQCLSLMSGNREACQYCKELLNYDSMILFFVVASRCFFSRTFRQPRDIAFKGFSPPPLWLLSSLNIWHIWIRAKPLSLTTKPEYQRASLTSRRLSHKPLSLSTIFLNINLSTYTNTIDINRQRMFLFWGKQTVKYKLVNS